MHLLITQGSEGHTQCHKQLPETAKPLLQKEANKTEHATRHRPTPSTMSQHRTRASQQNNNKFRAELLVDPYMSVCTKEGTCYFLDKHGVMD